MFVNLPSLFDGPYLRYLVNHFRTHLPYPEVPIKLDVRSRHSESTEPHPLAEGERVVGEAAIEKPPQAAPKPRKKKPAVKSELWDV